MVQSAWCEADAARPVHAGATAGAAWAVDAGLRREAEYSCLIQGQPTRVIVSVHRNAAGQAQELAVLHRPRSSVLLFSRLMGEKFAGTPTAEFFLTGEP